MKKEDLILLREIYTSLIYEDVKDVFFKDLEALENEFKKNVKIITTLKKTKSKDEISSILSKFE